MELNPKKPPKRRDDRVILQFDYDCFYAQVFENKTPSLKSVPLGVKQKNCLSTCNYVARARGLRKLMTVTEAKKMCPELVLVDGEDLTPFRDMSKVLYAFLKSFSWNGKVERLGFDEVFMDVTDIVDYNIFCLNRASLADSFFYLSETDPERGVTCDLTSIAGCVQGTASPDVDIESPTYLRLLLGSHLAQHLRLNMQERFGFTSTCGISTNKLLSKLVGGRNKPSLQTTLLALKDDDAVAFIDEYVLRKIPGIGFKTAQVLESYVTSQKNDADSHSFESTATAREVRLHPEISPGSLETLLGGPGAERGVGTRVWGLLHGVDPTEVKEANDIPTQISIEDTYKGLQGLAQITEELHKLSYSLVRRMRVDLVVPDENADMIGAQKWIAKPKTLRLSIRSYTPQGTLNYNSRISRSAPLSNFIFSLVDEVDQLAERLVAEALLPLLRRLQPDRGHRWNLQMLNICVANMAIGAADDKNGAGRDISAMFKHQDEALRPWRVVSEPEGEEFQPDGDDVEPEGQQMEQIASEAEESDAVEDDWETPENTTCPKCGHSIPMFAISAHTRYHELEG